MSKSAMQAWADDVREKQGPVIVPETHVPTANEINNAVYLACRYVAQWPMRQADLGVVLLMSGNSFTSVAELQEKLGQALGEYLWDHILGEPEDPSEEDVVYGVRAVIHALYTMPEETRNNIEAS